MTLNIKCISLHLKVSCQYVLLDFGAVCRAKRARKRARKKRRVNIRTNTEAVETMEIAWQFRSGDCAVDVLVDVSISKLRNYEVRGQRISNLIYLNITRSPKCRVKKAFDRYKNETKEL